MGEIAADAEPGVNTTYAVPAGNLFPVGQAKTRPEIFAMGFRQPFTVHTDPAKPGIVVTGEYCNDTALDAASALAGRHVRVEPAQQAGQPRLAALRGR